MHIEDFRDFCLAKKLVTEEFPFNETALVYKVAGKMFALTDVDLFESINLKCDPAWALELREQYPAIRPGFHMNKKHWNTVALDGTLADYFIKELIDHSYKEVISKLPKKLKAEFE